MMLFQCGSGIFESLGLLIVVMVVASSGVHGSTSKATASTQRPQNQNFISIPLKPHHALEQERRSLLSLRGGGGDVDDRRYRHRNRNLQASATAVSVEDGIPQQMVGLFQGYGTHYVDLWCGHPKPQRQTLIVGTGSDMTGFPCSNCVDCGASTFHIDRTYREAESETFHRMTCAGSDQASASNGCAAYHARCDRNENDCKVAMSYAEGSSWTAIESIDTCYVGGPHHVPLTHEEGADNDIDPFHASHFAFDLVFGCQTSITGLFKRQLADGMMGMNKAMDSFWFQMYRANKMGNSKAFALCFSRQPTVDREGTIAGALTLGGVDKRLHDEHSTMVYADSSSTLSSRQKDQFYVHVRNIYLRKGEAGESSLSTLADPTEGLIKLNQTTSSTTTNANVAIIESGTTDTYWNRGIEQSFKQVYLQMVGREYNHYNQHITKQEMEKLPTILFQLDVETYNQNSHIKSVEGNGIVGLVGSIIDPEHPKDVLLAFPPSHYMEYIEETKSYVARFYPDDPGQSTFGANSIMGHNVHFDVDHNRIGFAESPCDYSHLLQEYGYESVLDIDSEEDGNEVANDDDEIEFVGDDDIAGEGDDIAVVEEDDDAMDYFEDDDNAIGDDAYANFDTNGDKLKPGGKPPYIPEDDEGDSTQSENAMGSTTNSGESSSSKEKKKKGKGPLLFFGLILMGGVGVYVVTGGQPSNLYNRITGGGGGYHQVTQQQSLSGEDGALEVELSLAKFYRRLGGGNGST